MKIEAVDFFYLSMPVVTDAGDGSQDALVPGAQVAEIPSGCCGMAGAFGYEKEHYEVSMKVGELVLFPEIRKITENVLIAAPGTSCRHQIKDGTGRNAYHPIAILFDALIK